MANLLTIKEAAEYLGISHHILNNWRREDRPGLPYLRLGTAIRYRTEDLDALKATREVPLHEKTCATCQHGYQFAPGEYGCAIQAAMRCKPALVSRQWMARRVMRADVSA